MSKFDNMGKVELRAACKLAGVKGYGNLTNDGMRAALNDKQAEQGIGAQGSDGVPRPLKSEVRKAEKDEARAAALASPRPAPVIETPVVEGPREKVTGTVVKPKSLKIEKGREKQNDVTRPSAGSICRAIWDQLDAKRAADKAVPSFEALRDLMKQYGWAKNTAMTQFQRWKQFNGVMPRSAAEATEEDESTNEE